MTKKIRVGVIFGGQSAEHEVSLLSARNVVEALDKNKYEVVCIGIDKAGEWHLRDEAFLLNHVEKEMIGHETALMSLQSLQTPSLKQPVDVIFPVLHGTYGEDGTIQGLLKLAQVPFVGASVLSSAVAMDKDVMKRLLRDAGIPTADFCTLSRSASKEIDFAWIKENFGLPFFVKPANLGSSVGISKVKQESEWESARAHAFDYDHKIVIEEYIQGREIECSVLGNEHPIASLPGEVIPQHEFYSYEAKYLDSQGAHFKIPADLDEKTVQRIQEMAIATYQVLCCEGMARVDFFLKDNGALFVNEMNTIPGFTNISMYPKMWEASGLSYTALLDQLIQLALDRFNKEKLLKNCF